MFATLAPMLAVRRSMRLWNPEATPPGFADRARSLTRKLPDQPAAIPIYLHGWTRLLVLDFDAKHGHGPADVDHDVEHCLAQLHACGARVISDRSPSGGRHILVPLAHGSALTRAQVEPVLRALAAGLPSLDITPMLNPQTGSITPPGSRCRDGGYRTLDGPLDDAVHALTVRCAPDFWHNLTDHLSSADPTPASDARGHDLSRAPVRAMRANARAMALTSGDHSDDGARGLWDGVEADTRLHAARRLRTPMPTAVVAFAREGHTAGPRWRAHDGRLDRSAARQSVLTAAALRGYSFTELLAELPASGGTWHGLAACYHRYGHRAHRALHRDWISACRWASRHSPLFLAHGHKNIKHTGGPTASTKHTSPHRRWLASATAWADAQWPHSSKRWTAHAVLQALAYASTRNGGMHRGTPTVEFGGRSLSLLAGDMPETTIWQTLREIRDLPGAPILRIRAATGHLADRYALTTPTLHDKPVTPGSARIARTTIEPIHPAWRIIGLHCRRLYDTVLAGTTNPGAAIAAAGLARSTGYTALATLATTGLIQHTHNTATPGPTSLDQIAHAHGLPARRHDTIARHRHERALWAAWLTTHTDRPPRALPVPSTSHQDRALRPYIRQFSCDTAPSTAADSARRGGARVARTAPTAGTRTRSPSARTRSTAPRALLMDSDDRAASQSVLPEHPNLADAEVYIETRPSPRLGGRWIVMPDLTTWYQRPTGAITTSTVPVTLLRTSPTWKRSR